MERVSSLRVAVWKIRGTRSWSCEPPTQTKMARDLVVREGSRGTSLGSWALDPGEWRSGDVIPRQCPRVAPPERLQHTVCHRRRFARNGVERDGSPGALSWQDRCARSGEGCNGRAHGDRWLRFPAATARPLTWLRLPEAFRQLRQ